MLDTRELFHCMCLMSGMFPRFIRGQAVDAIFVWGRAADEWQGGQYDEGVLTLAATLHRQTNAPIVIPGYVGLDKGQGETGYPGPVVWARSLQDLGVAADCILSTTGSGYNTKTEMEDYLDLASGRGWGKTLGVTQQPHALRAMLGTIQSLKDRGLRDLMIAPVWPSKLDWSRACHGSQGMGPYPRSQWIHEEFDRIPRYQAKGDLCSLNELIEYLTIIYRP